MSYSWKLKTIALGSPKVGKTSFLKHKADFKEESSAIALGVSFESLDCIVSEQSEDKKCHTTVWDVKPKNRFLFVLPNLLKGSAGCLLFFDLSNRETFRDLNTWMGFIQLVRGNIPVILIGTKSDLNIEVSEEEIDEFMINHQIFSYYPISIHGKDYREQIIKDLVTQILSLRKERYSIENDIELMMTRFDIPEIERGLKRIMGGGNIIINRGYNTLEKEERDLYKSFIEYYSFCPVCHKKNHYSSLKSFYFNSDLKAISVKARLIELMEMKPYRDFSNLEEFRIGIPCCECYKEIFKQ